MDDQSAIHEEDSQALQDIVAEHIFECPEAVNRFPEE